MRNPEDILSPCLPTGYTGTASRSCRDGKGRFLKWCGGGHFEGVRLEASIFEELAGSIYFPDIYEVGQNYILMEDLGDSETVTDLEVALRHGCSALADMRAIGVYHNDLGSQGNIIVKDNVPRIVDFGRFTRGSPRPGAFPDYCLLLELVRSFMRGREQAELVNK